MTTLARRLMPRISQALTSTRTRDARRWLAERRRRLRGEPHRILYFHQVDDPYSQLAAQALVPLAERYDFVLEPHLVGPPPDEAAPERERLAAFSRKDAADVAPAYGLRFPRPDAPPPDARIQSARVLLAAALAADRFAECAPRIGAALWAGDEAELKALEVALPASDPLAAGAAEASGDALRRRLGHYLGGMFYYAGEWYWGVDRLAHLERRLQSLGAWRRDSRAAPIAPRPDPARAGPVAGATRRLCLEFFPSMRSPYTYIALERVYALPQRLPVDLVLRPVLPMVMRGLPVPRAKRLYIHLDTKREADDAGVPYGRVCDPVGRPVERVFSLYPFARERGRAAELLLAFARASFAEGVDTGEDEGLRRVVLAAGLDWREASRHLDGEGWRDELEANRRDLLELGLWGVPSFRLRGGDDEPDFCTWGQDRIWLVEQEIRRRCTR